MKWREEVQLSGIPVVWNTNLEDGDLRELYGILLEDPDLRELKVELRASTTTICFAPPFVKTIAFREGYCLCIGWKDWLLVTYRSTSDWDIWEARRAEIAELKEEESEQVKIEELLFRAGDRHLRENVLESLKTGQFEEAARLIEQRVEHATSFEERMERDFRGRHVGYKWRVWTDALRLFCYLPTTDAGMAFLRGQARGWWDFCWFAEGYEGLSRVSKEEVFAEVDSYHFLNRTANEVVLAEIDRVFRAAVERFPREGRLYKRVCLFWGRKGKLGLAIEYCRLGAERGLADGTKKGFPFRLKRLLNKARVTSK
jgi:hypothetical protein